MSLRNCVVLPVILFTLAMLVACGSTNSATPPPSGAFSNTDFNGTYTFSTVGQDVGAGGNLSTLIMAGSLNACGCTGGQISGGNVDLVDNTGGIGVAAIGSTSTYSISKDGRGFAKLLITPTGGTQFEADVDFVLTSSSHGLITRFDQGGTGSGTLDVQPAAVAQSAIENTPYAFSLSGSFNGSPLAMAGAFTLDSSGNISTSGANAGVADVNSYPAILAQTPLTGSLTVGSGTTPGTASLTTAFAAQALTFDVYAIDATHLKLIESDGVAILVGDVFAQPSASIPSGNLVFTMAGLDSTGTLFSAGGFMVSNGSNTISTGSFEDVNDGGLVDNGTNPAVPNSFTGSFGASPSGSGRFVVTLTGFFGGSMFAAYPSSGGIQMLEIDTGANIGGGNAGITGGVALLQTPGATVAASQGYGLNNTGEDVSNGWELDEIAEFQTATSGGGVTGLIDFNDGAFTGAGSLGTGSVNGTYMVNSDGTGSATLSTDLQEVFFYAVDNSTALFISVDPTQAALGSFQIQTTPGSDQAAVMQPHALPMLRVIPHSRSAKPRNKGLIAPAR
jgi:hypothetical protein